MKKDKLSDLREKILRDVRRYAELTSASKEFEAGMRVPYGGRVYDWRDVCSLVDSSLEFWLTEGRFSAKLENALAARLGVKHCALVNSGSSANLLAISALTAPELGPRRLCAGDEVITAACCFPTTVAPVFQCGAVPVFIDVSLPSYNIDCGALESALSNKTKAVLLAHTLGNPFNIRRVKQFCKRHGLWLIEDNCDALGSLYKDGKLMRPTGSFGDISTSSFYPAHHITTGEGGAVFTDNPMLSKIVRSLRDWGRDCWCRSGHDNTCGCRFGGQFGILPSGYDHKYVYSRFGYNLKMTDLQASVGVSQLEKLDDFIEKRRANWQYLRGRLGRFSKKLLLPEPEKDSLPSWFGFVITVKDDAPFTRGGLTAFLESRNIQTRTLFAGNIVRHPCFDERRASGRGYRICGGLENTDRVMNSTFWIGVYPGLSKKQLDYMADSIAEFIRSKSR